MRKSDTQHGEIETRSRLNPGVHDGHEHAAKLEAGVVLETPEKATPQPQSLIRRTGARLGRFVRRIGENRGTYVSDPTTRRFVMQL